MGRVTDIDVLQYQYQEAAGLREAGWSVEPPIGERWAYSLCIGADYRGCPVRTPNLRCHYCNRTIRLGRAA